MSDLTLVIAVVKSVGLALGGFITYLAVKAARRTGSPSMRAFAVGFGIITFGAVVGGGVDQFTGFDLELGVLLQSLLTAVGFLVLAWSLYVNEPSQTAVER